MFTEPPTQQYLFPPKTVLNSIEQLATDFGEYPPYPLAGESLQSKVDVVAPRGLAGALNCFSIMGLCVSFDSHSSTAWIRANVDLGPDCSKSLREVNEAIIVLPLILRRPIARLFTAYFVWKMGIDLFKRFKQRKSGLGLFHPTGPTSGRITLTARVHSSDTTLAALLSHEHLHYLQYLDDRSFRLPFNNLHAVLSEDKHNHKTLLYLLDRREMEARLHEIVLSHYRTNRFLPIDRDGFLTLLANSEYFGSEVMGLLTEYGYANADDKTRFTERARYAADDLINVWSEIKIECSLEFITDLLPVLYGNLLRYYGDKKTSEDFLGQIPRPNLYDALYGDTGLATSDQPSATFATFNGGQLAK
jgi:hypothetical protein